MRKTNNMKELTAQQISKKYYGRYVEIYECPSWDTDENGVQLYEVRKSYTEIHENTCRAEDVGTELAYTR